MSQFIKENNYLDHAATTYVRQEVLEKMLPFFAEKFGNPSSLYDIAQESKNAIEESREICAEILNCSPSEIYFTSGGTESNNMAIKGLLSSNSVDYRVISSSIEHHAVIHPIEQLSKRGVEVVFIDVNKNGLINLESFRKKINKSTKLVSFMYVNNEIGVVQDLRLISKIVKEFQQENDCDIIFHSDAVQAPGKLSLDTEILGVDLMSISGHKIYAPKGIGLLYIRNGIEVHPLISGGGQENQMRSGTENVPYIVAFAEALRLSDIERHENERKMKKLSDLLISTLNDRITDYKLNSSRDNCVPGIINLSFPGYEGESIIIGLNFKGIYVSSGSACSSASLEPSHVLSSMGLTKEESLSSIRVSLGKYNNENHIYDFVNALEAVLSQLASYKK
ncbi:MAG: cysteine desulfurase NifS [Chloroflexi bacterium]|nr:cysteine desulfurase NifS [Chloroflexota bacterium]